MDFVQSIISSAENRELLASLNTNATGNAVSLMFYNPSYYGGFVCILIPFSLGECLAVNKIKDRVMYYVIFAGLIFGVLVSNSTTALYIAIFECVLTIGVYIVKSDKIKVTAISSLYLVGVGMAVVVIYSVFADGGLFDLITNANSATGKAVEDRFEIKDIQLESNSIFVMGEEKGIRITYNDKQIKCTDENSEGIATVYKDGVIRFENEMYKDLNICLVANSDKTSNISAKIAIDAGYDDTIDFYILADGTLSGVGQNNSVLKDIGGRNVPDGLKKYYGIFTGRGYAWINSIPLLKDSLLKGVGPGNFVYHFKQQDYVGMLDTHGSVKYIIDKPHNSYIQYTVNIGLLGMLSFFGVFVYVLIKGVNRAKGIKGLCKQETSVYSAGLISICGFLVYSIINDSIITVTPLMCMILGVTLAAGYVIEKGKQL